MGYGFIKGLHRLRVQRFGGLGLKLVWARHSADGVQGKIRT